MAETTTKEEEKLAKSREEKIRLQAEKQANQPVPLTKQEKGELATYRAEQEHIKALEERDSKVGEERTADDMLEDAYEGLPVIYEDLKREITLYFWGNGRWVDPTPEDPPPPEALAANSEQRAKG